MEPKTYSRQWVESQGLNIKWDFDIIDEFDMLPNYVVSIVKCDGYGFEGVARKRNKCYLVYPGNIYKAYDKVIKKK